MHKETKRIKEQDERFPIQNAIKFLLAFFVLSMAWGCSNYSARQGPPKPLLHAQQEIPEEQLLDVGIMVFDIGELTEKEAKKEGTTVDVRKAESHFIPYHLKNTLQQSSHWGSVRVTPAETDTVDVLVRGEILESNGAKLALRIEVLDASGKRWFRKTYKEKVTVDAYRENIPRQKDPFQSIYHLIANDMAKYKLKLKPKKIANIRSISKLKFAGDFAPDAFGDYLKKKRKNILVVNRLPADGDPMMKRLLLIREREYMYVDTLNEYYESYYNDMWPTYENWRKLNLSEQAALEKVRRDAFIRQAGGVLMVALAIALEAKDVENTNILKGALVVAGGQVFMSGINISKQADMHKAAIQELSESFGNEMKPIVMEFQGKKYELSGSAEEQYARWRELLREIYYAETGFDKPDTQTQTPADSSS